MRASSLRHRFTIVAIAAPLGASLGAAQTSQAPPSRRIMPLCVSFMTSMGDLSKMASGITDTDERSNALSMAAVAEATYERCIAVHSLLFTYELLGPGPDRKKTGEYVAFRMGQYAERKSDIEYFNGLVGQTKLPGVAAEARSMRDRLRALADSLVSLRPK